MKRISSALPILALLVAFASPLDAQSNADVGEIDFPTSAVGEAQNLFVRGVTILHSFGWKQARTEFHAAQAADPDFAMAYWGESLAYNHPLNSDMDTTEPRKALERLAPTPEERLAKAPTAREKGFLSAVEILWGEGDSKDRRVGYMEAMRDLHEQYPEDDEVTAFYALSLLSASAATRDLTMRLNVRAGTLALNLFEDNPNHPGAAHYTIHSFDHPLMAPLALEAAHRFAEIASAVSHARHMPTHIFIQHGMWDLVSWNNQYAFDAAVDLWEPGDAVGDGVHALDWGHYGDLQMGDYAKARVWMQRLDELTTLNGYGTGGERGAAGIARANGAVSLLKARYIVDTEEWEIQPITAESKAHELLATGLSAYRTDDAATMAAAETALKVIADGDDDDYAKIMHKQVGALRHAAMGHADVAIGLMDEAVAIIQTIAPPRGSATPVKPLYELYGEMLLDLDRPAEAVAQFETSLLRMANRPRSLLGAARAHAMLGHHAMAAESYRQVAEVWKGRDIEGLHEAMSFLEETEEMKDAGGR